jgi:hypothetical protein
VSTKARAPLSLPKLANDPLLNVSNETLEWIARAAFPELALASAPVHKVIRRMCDVLDILDGRSVHGCPSIGEYKRVLNAFKVLTAGAFLNEGEAPK